MTNTDYRIGIIGIGAIADHHAKAIGNIENATVVAGSCRTESRGREFAAEYDCEWYADYEDLLDEAAPDVVTIATPSGAHLEPTLAAADRGVHVLCEKPLEITTERIDRMIDAADDAGVVLGGIFQQHFNDVVRTAREAVVEGRFGDLSVANAHVPWWREDDYYEGSWKGTENLDGGGALMNQSIHAIDAIQWLVAGGMDIDPAMNPVEEVFAYTDVKGHSPDHVEVEDTAVAVVRYRDGTLGQILGATSMYPGTLRSLEIAGRNGTAEILEDELATWQFREERPEDEEIRAAFSAETEASGASDPMAIDCEGHRRNIEAFLDSIDADRKYELDGVQARKAVAVIEAIYESAERAEPVRVS